MIAHHHHHLVVVIALVVLPMTQVVAWAPVSFGPGAFNAPYFARKPQYSASSRNHVGSSIAHILHPSTESSTLLHSSDDGNNISSSDEKKKTKIGSSEYYQGFVTQSINDEPEERVTGDAVLIPTLKFVGSISVVLILLTVGFLASNDLL